MAKIGILGTGTMGPQIAAALAVAGHTISLFHRKPPEQFMPRARQYIRLTGKRQKLPEDQLDQCLARITPVSRLEDLHDAQAVIESIVEDLKVKQEMFQELETRCPSAVLLATNTSSLPVSQISAPLKNPGRLVGMHFFNPVFEIHLVEIFTTPGTHPAALELANTLVRSVHKDPLQVPESYANRILIPMINEACLALESAPVKPEQIDLTLKLGARHPIGPLALADLIGIDIVVAILETYEARFGSRYRPASTLRTMLERGHLGRKAGQGFYSYGKPKTPVEGH